MVFKLNINQTDLLVVKSDRRWRFNRDLNRIAIRICPSLLTSVTRRIERHQRETKSTADDRG